MSIKSMPSTGRARTAAALAALQLAAPDVTKWSNEVLTKLKARKGTIVSAEISGQNSFIVVLNNVNLTSDDFKSWMKLDLMVNISKSSKGAQLLFTKY